ncbi:very-long-chain aldehyde decarbonylase GL1-4 isoform X1 [Oryza brachyantha]|uniref:aldehyde oxygenase (deformylating) n=1 Tax=Oryza brachyantha TaxID=4533 RepID=J3LEW6_ORYBR|nr:very-long-chain aldehyde decarbonylase GL1-4 isoform X1 [Oryza brachyantha]
MATRPGPLTEWPWQRLGNFKYVVMAPVVVHGAHRVVSKGWGDIDLAYSLILPSLLLRMIHNQIWISLSRYQTARSKHRIVDRGIEFDQVDRERGWDDQILFNGLLFYVGYLAMPSVRRMPLWRTDGAVMTALVHTGPVEFLYYWFHRALHHHFLYSRYHSHHHASIVTEPITSVIHPFAEHVVYFILFAIPILSTIYVGNVSAMGIVAYIAYIDFMNNMGHCNFELVPSWIFQIFPPLKYMIYTPSFHSLHHTQFRTNYSLFMPFYDYIYNTMDKSSDELYESSLKGTEETPDLVHLTHMTSLESAYHLRIGIASIASKPYSNSAWYMWALWPLAWLSMVLAWIYGSSAFVVERIKLNKMKMQTWAIPRYNFQYGLTWEREPINDLIEKAILDADMRGVKVVSLGLLNQTKQLNGNGELFRQKYPKLGVRIVDGSGLATAVVLKSIPSDAKKVFLHTGSSKIARAIAMALCSRGVQVIMNEKKEYDMLKLQIPENRAIYLKLSSDDIPQVKLWIVDNIDDDEQKMAPKGTTFIPISQFPLKKVRRDCTYASTPAMRIPEEMKNVHSCENWLPRRVMSAWHIAGILHALEGWNTHECGDDMMDAEKSWSAAIRHGFLPLSKA